MRASSHGRHLSGAERIVPVDAVAEITAALIERAFNAPLGPPDKIYCNSEQIDTATLQFAKLPDVYSYEVASFQEINVSFPGEKPKATSDCKSRFVMNGYIYEDGSAIKVTVHLTDTKSGKQIWGETIRADIDVKNLLTFQGKVAREIAAKTTGEFGVIPLAMIAESKNKPLQELNTYEAMLQYQNKVRLSIE